MLIAIIEDDNRSKVLRKGQRGKCPKCGNEVIARCGQINIWHWAHKAKKNCDWYSSESDWHREWKALFPSNRVEVYMEGNRADAIDRMGRIWEFQNSYLKGEEIDEREKTYENLLWIWNISNQQKLITFDKYSEDALYQVDWYKIRYQKICNEKSKKFDSYSEADEFREKMKSYGWESNMHSIPFINFQNSTRYQASDIYKEYKQNTKKSLWLYRLHAFSRNLQKPEWLPRSIDGIASCFWWQQSRSIQQCRKPVILDLKNDLFFAVSRVFTETISTFFDNKYGTRVNEASFAEGFLFEISKRKLIYAFENPGKSEQLSLL